MQIFDIVIFKLTFFKRNIELNNSEISSNKSILTICLTISLHELFRSILSLLKYQLDVLSCASGDF